FGAFLWTGFRDFADDLRTGFLAMGVLNGAAAPAGGRSGTAGHRPQLGAARENLKSYHAVGLIGSSCGSVRSSPANRARRQLFPNPVGETGKSGHADVPKWSKTSDLRRRRRQNALFSGISPRKQR